MKTLSDTPNESVGEELQSLSPEKRIQQDSVIGIYPATLTGSPAAAIWLPSRQNLLQGVQLSVYHPEGNQVTNPMLKKRISQELGALLGGWFAHDLTPYIQLYDGLVSEATKEKYASGGMTIEWDEPKEAFYYLAFEAPPWQVQAGGESGVFHTVFIGQTLSEKDALRPGGHPAVRPLGEITPLLAMAASGIALDGFTDKTDEYPQNVFDVYLEGNGSQVKAGVRRNVRIDDDLSESDRAYLYGIRINIDLCEGSGAFRNLRSKISSLIKRSQRSV